MNKGNQATPVGLEVAQAEVNRWLDTKKIGQSERTAREFQIETLQSAVMDGVLRLNDKNQWEQTLNFPLSDVSVTKLSYKDRMTANENISASGNAGGNPQLVMSCFISHLTGEASELIRKMDTVDYKIASAIGIFFY